MKRLSMVGIALLLLAMVIQFPAAWLAPFIGQATAERWRMAGAEGTLWHGRAMLYAFDRPSGYWHPGGAVSWRVMWANLLRGVLAAQLRFDNDGHAELRASVRGWTLERVDAIFPARQLAVLLPSTIGDYGWAGNIAVRGNAFRCSWRRLDCGGQLDLTWHAAATPQIPGAFGDYGLRLTGEGDALRFTLRTIHGRLQAVGAGEISGGRLRFSGEAHASGEDVSLESMLRAIGRPGPGPGRYLVDYRESPGTR